MESKRVDFYRAFFSELDRKRRSNSPDAKEFEDKLFHLIGRETDGSKRLETIEEQINRLCKKFEIIDRESELRASEFYKPFSEATSFLKTTKQKLIRNFELYDLSLKREDHVMAAKYVMLQIEGALNIVEHKLIEWVEANATKKVEGGKEYYETKTENRGRVYTAKYFIGVSGTLKYLNARGKYLAAREYFKISYLSTSKIDLLLDIRNLESHHLSNDKLKKGEEQLKELRSRPFDYYGEALTFLSKCINSELFKDAAKLLK